MATETPKYHRFIDEVAYTTFYGDKRKLVVGQTGVSTCFGIGLIKFGACLEEVREAVMARKIPVLFEKQHHGHEDEFYADILSHLIKARVKRPGTLVLNIADYLCGSVQRVFERGDQRHYQYLMDRIRLVVDLCDASKYAKSGNYHTKRNPLKIKQTRQTPELPKKRRHGDDFQCPQAMMETSPNQNQKARRKTKNPSCKSSPPGKSG